jgi:uncharacterized alpha-E superfamily protein
MLDLLVRDAEHPRALAFQGRAIAGDLAALAVALGTESEGALDAALPRLGDAELAALEGEEPAARAARHSVAVRLETLVSAASALSDRLSLRHFSHINLDARALSS